MTATATIPEQIIRSTTAAESTGATVGAIVMGADYRGLGVVRSLGRRGFPVWLINRGGHLVASMSRYVQHRIFLPQGDDKATVDHLLVLGATHKLAGWVLIPTDDHAVALTAHHHAPLSAMYRLTTPPWEKLRWACDKRLMYSLASELGIHQTWTACPENRDGVASVDYPFPLILKPAIRRRPMNQSTPKAWPAADRESLLACFDEACSQLAPEDLIIQEIVPGGGDAQFSYAALCKDGDVIASLMARRTRQFPADFGHFSTYVETVEEPRIIEPAARLLAAIRFTGLVEIEFKRDARDGNSNCSMSIRVCGAGTRFATERASIFRTCFGG